MDIIDSAVPVSAEAAPPFSSVPEHHLPASPPKFSVPEHPSVRLLQELEKNRGRKKEKEVEVDTPQPPPYQLRDPHEHPSFTPDSIKNPVHPILYLPPLISSLPSNSESSSELTSESDSDSDSGAGSDPESKEDRPAVLTTSTRLPSIDPVSLSLHRALHYFRPLSDQYAAVSYADAFNWDELRLPEEEEREWYCVAFRSRRKEGSNGDALYEADRRAHEEAVSNGGLLMYWYGVPDPTTGLNLATCIWQSRAHAAAANSRPDHIQAMRLAKESYEVYTLERHVLRKYKGSTNVVVEEYAGGDVGW